MRIAPPPVARSVASIGRTGNRSFDFNHRRDIAALTLATRYLPESFVRWNDQHGAPFGERAACSQTQPDRASPVPRRSGLFSFQANNTTRTFEYPWAFHATPLSQGMQVLEIGGGLSGFQFVLDRCGCKVTNVDPGGGPVIDGMSCDQASMARLNAEFGTSVELQDTLIQRANLAPDSFDRVFSISVVEHLEQDAILDVMTHAFRCLKPGGYLVATADLFLNTAPFTSRPSNEHGRNIDIRALVEAAPFELAQGTRAELNGYPEFDPDYIQSHLERYLVGVYPALAQCFVLRKNG